MKSRVYHAGPISVEESFKNVRIIRHSTSLLCLCLFAVSGNALAQDERPADSSGLPDILLFTVDTLRSDHLQCYGYGLGTSPHIDAIAREGLRCDDVFSTYTHTLPAMHSIFTGVNPTLRGAYRCTWNGFQDFDLADYSTLAGVFSDAGYRCAFLTNHVGLDGAISRHKDWEYNVAESLDAAKLTEAALAWLEREADGPKLLWVHQLDPHFPYRPAPTFEHRFVEPGKLNESFAKWLKLPETDLVPGEVARRALANEHHELA